MKKTQVVLRGEGAMLAFTDCMSNWVCKERPPLSYGQPVTYLITLEHHSEDDARQLLKDLGIKARVYTVED